MVHFVTPLLVVAASISSFVSAVPLPRPNSDDASYSDGTSHPAVQPDNYGYGSPGYNSGSSGYGYQAPPMKDNAPMYKPPAPAMAEPPMTTKAPMVEPPMTTKAPMVEPPMTTKAPMVEPPMETKAPMAPPPPPPPSYGSGKQDWGNDYNSCVNKCMATYGGPTTPYTPPPSKAQPPSGGKVHTVLVAPTSGVFRYVPPFLDVPVGETVKFVWNGPNNHTVSKGSQLDLCNKTADAFFTSGIRNGSSEFLQTVNNTDTTFFYCAVGKHCALGMFGLINPKKGADGTNTTVKMMMPKWTKQYPNLANAWDTVHAKTAGTPADTWGDNFDVSQVQSENHEALASNIVYYRSFLAENPGVQDLNAGATLPSGAASFNLPPQSLQSLLTGTAGNPAGAPGVPAGSAPTNAVPTGAVPPQGSPAAAQLGTSGAGSLKSSGLMVAVVAVLATLVAL